VDDKGDDLQELPMNTVPRGFSPLTDLPEGFLEFYLPLHAAFTPRQQALRARRAEVLEAAHRGDRPTWLPPSEATTGGWRIDLPSWCADQRNQMTGPADDGELVVKLLNSGAPGVMLDLEDSMANFWPNLSRGLRNTILALHGELDYFDQKRNQTVSIRESETVTFVRPRGLHLSQAGIPADEITSAALFVVAMIAFQVDRARIKHPLSFYIPKSESAAEALWWRDLFQALERSLGWPSGWIRCMALVESHPLAYQMEEFIYHLRDHIVGLNLGRWDYMASLIHFNLMDPDWILPDRNTIPHDVPFFQNLRLLMPEICHRRGILAIGGMTALYPSREDPALNARALAVLEQDKRNEAQCGMDGAWTGHPDQNQIALLQFPHPNQLEVRRPELKQPELRVPPIGVGRISLEGTQAAVRTVIRYRYGVLNGRGASLIDGYMEDLATDRIYRLMLAQRVRHHRRIELTDAYGRQIDLTADRLGRIFDEELERLLSELPPDTPVEERRKYEAARGLSERMIARGRFDPG
jgi:malate synthase